MRKDKYVLATVCKNCKKTCKVRFHPSLASAMVKCKQYKEDK